jgi:hypothetical protein
MTREVPLGSAFGSKMRRVIERALCCDLALDFAGYATTPDWHFEEPGRCADAETSPFCSDSLSATSGEVRVGDPSQVEPVDAFEIGQVDRVEGKAVRNRDRGDHGVVGTSLDLAPRTS